MGCTATVTSDITVAAGGGEGCAMPLAAFLVSLLCCGVRVPASEVAVPPETLVVVVCFEAWAVEGVVNGPACEGGGGELEGRGRGLGTEEEDEEAWPV